jgi:hypothetical protein
MSSHPDVEKGGRISAGGKKESTALVSPASEDEKSG